MHMHVFLTIQEAHVSGTDCTAFEVILYFYYKLIIDSMADDNHSL